MSLLSGTERAAEEESIWDREQQSAKMSSFCETAAQADSTEEGKSAAMSRYAAALLLVAVATHFASRRGGGRSRMCHSDKNEGFFGAHPVRL